MKVYPEEGWDAETFQSVVIKLADGARLTLYNVSAVDAGTRITEAVQKYGPNAENIRRLGELVQPKA